MARFLIRLLINAVAVYAAALIVPGIHLDNPGWVSYIVLGLVIGLLNALIKPILKFLSCPLIILTLGLFTLLINTYLFYLAGEIGTRFHAGFSVENFWSAFWGGLIVSLVNIVLTTALKDEIKKH